MKKNLRFFTALFISKTAMFTQRLFGMNASYFPGKLAIKLCPDFLGLIDKPETIISVTGTNGKTTVCNMIIDTLLENGYDVLHNRAGSNINAGVASALIGGSSVFGKAKKKIAVFEIDERSSKLIYPYVKPTYAVCTNLFRDSIHRNAHAEFIFRIISDSLPKESHMILNADDLISAGLAPENKRTYFSIAPMNTDLTESINIINDMRICPKCNHKLSYHYVRYHHIGNAYCPSCGFASPKSDYVAAPDFEKNTLSINHHGDIEQYSLVSNSIFNTYNQITAITLLREFGLSAEQIKTAFDKLNIVESRYSSEKAGATEVITHMAKGQNPIACSCVFDYVKNETGKKEIILMLDDVFDRIASSEIMTWIYDADFEFLNDDSISHIIISGVRCEDYKLRLLLAGVPEEKLTCVTKELDTPDYLHCFGTDKIFILHELYAADEALQVRDKVVARLKNISGGGTAHE
ncbi:MAG: DUF1727 domain-containing protein [Lachnospiraceae bacterium]|nr:DUF1727 domain-containing protein [Lachnospiraceae bacterium]